MLSPPTNIDLKPKRHHGYSFLLFILGTLFPPLAVAARFGIGSDFWLNLLLTICGYFPGHGHNFYIQNIRNNKNKARTPKWAARYGLVDTTVMDRKKKRSEWAKRYGERLPESTLEGQAFEEGQTPDRHDRVDHATGQTSSRNSDRRDLWKEDEEQFYNGERGGRHGQSVTSLHSESSSNRWSYPANFSEAVVESGPRRKSRSSKKDRWARTEEAYNSNDGPERKRKKKKRRQSEDIEQLPPLDSEPNHSRPDETSGDVDRNGQQRDPLDHEF